MTVTQLHAHLRPLWGMVQLELAELLGLTGGPVRATWSVTTPCHSSMLRGNSTVWQWGGGGPLVCRVNHSGCFPAKATLTPGPEHTPHPVTL